MITDILKESEKYVSRLLQARDFLLRYSRKPRLLLILGSGLGALADSLENQEVIPYQDIPHFPVSSVPGHAGNLVFGSFGEVEVAAFQGRVHCYEGFPECEVAFGVRTLGLLGVRSLLVTNAAGGINPSFKQGDLMLIENHITLLVRDPSECLQHATLGPMFYDQTHPYDRDLMRVAEHEASKLGFQLKRGIFFMTRGPRYESAADITALRALGADAVAMSTIPEVLAARQMGFEKILGISLITNMAAGISRQQMDHSEVLETSLAAKDRFGNLCQAIMPHF